MSLLIVGDPDDLTAVYIGHKAEERGESVVRLREDRFGLDWLFAFDDSDPDRDRLIIDGSPLYLANVRGAYVRFHASPEAPLLEQLEPALAEIYMKQRRSAHHLFLERLACPVANRPTAGHSNGSKPFQMQLLQDRVGLKPPCWIASNDADDIRAFQASYPNGTIVKSCSGLRSEVRLLDELFLALLAKGSPPVVVQERIHGHDVRVHTVGRSAFATHIKGTHGIDYRFADNTGEYEAGEVPNDIAERCHQFAAQERLLIAGFDFRVDLDGTWWCLECNPVPTFLPYELATGQPIADALLDELRIFRTP